MHVISGEAKEAVAYHASHEEADDRMMFSIHKIYKNSSGGRAAGLIYTCQARGHGFDSRCFPQI